MFFKRLLLGLLFLSFFVPINSVFAALSGSPSWASVSGPATFGGAGSPEGQRWKYSTCSSSQVMVGIRAYQWTSAVDEEYEEAQCDALSGATLGGGSWTLAPNATAVLSGGYKTAVCPSGSIMIGTRMYGIYSGLDEEHTDALCATISGATLGSPSWVSAPNANDTLWGGFKTANCPSGQVMVGVRDYQWTVNVDEEHTDAYCAPISFSTPPTVTLNSFTPSTITAGNTSSISFSSTNATSCAGSGIWNGDLGGTSNSGVSTPVMSAGTYTQSVTCSGPGGSATSVTRTLQVNPAVAPPTATISAAGPVASAEPNWWQKALSFVIGRESVAHAGTSTVITVGENAALTWSSTGATSCTISGNGVNRTDLNFDNYRLTGLPTGVFTYNISCSNVAGTATDSTTVTVNPPRVDGVCAGTHYDCNTGATPRLDGDTATEYRWTCMGSGGGTNSPQCLESKGSVPSTPSSLTAAPDVCGTGKINVSWNSSTGATSYQVRDNTTEVYNGSNTSFQHTGLAAGTTHNYIVRAANTSGTSSWSSMVSTNAPNTCATTVNGVCGAAAETCAAGTYSNSPADTAVNYQWTCLGSGSPMGANSGTCTAAIPLTYTITASAGSGGFISPSGSVSGITPGSSRSFTITENFPNVVDSVIVNTGSGNVNVGAVTSYTFSNINANGTISVTFRPGTTSGITQAQGCTIFSGQSNCTGRVSWTTAADAVSPIELTVSGTLFHSNNPAAFNQPVSIDYGNHVVTLTDADRLFNQATMTAVCFGTLIWSQGICQASGGALSGWPASCAIPVGQSTCDINFTWWTQNMLGATVFNTTRNMLYSTDLSGTAVPFPIAYGNNVVRLRDASLATRDSVTVRGTCAGVWNAVSGICEAGVPTATITAGTCTIPDGASNCTAQVSWTSSNLTVTPSVQQDGVEFSTLAIRAVNPAVANVNRRQIKHTAAGGSTFTFVHNGATLNTKSVGGTCVNGLFWDGTKCTSVCVPTDNCGNHATDIDNICVGSQYVISNDGCGNSISCPGTRSCDYNWKEVAP